MAVSATAGASLGFSHIKPFSPSCPISRRTQNSRVLRLPLLMRRFGRSRYKHYKGSECVYEDRGDVLGTRVFESGGECAVVVDSTIMCEPCKGRGWLVCEFCQGQKTNVKAENNRIYRRCPSCRAVGYMLCSSCKVFKCLTFPPDYADGQDIT